MRESKPPRAPQALKQRQARPDSPLRRPQRSIPSLLLCSLCSLLLLVMPVVAEPASILEPSRLMSGWVAARLAGEEASRTLFVDGTPGFLSGATGNTIPANLSATSAALKLAAGGPIAALTPQGAAAGTPFFNANANAAGGHGGVSVSSSNAAPISYASSNPARAINGGLPVGAGPIRLEMSLKERLAALSCRREERDKRALALRRFYVQQLRNYTLETRVSAISWNLSLPCLPSLFHAPHLPPLCVPFCCHRRRRCCCRSTRSL